MRVVPLRAETVRYGTVLELKDSRGNFKVRPDSGGATVIMKGSHIYNFKRGDRVMLDGIQLGDHVDFACGYSLADSSWPTNKVMRTMGIMHWGRVLREGLAAAFASLPPAVSPSLTSIVLYDPLLLGCKLPHGGTASYYMLVIVGKTPVGVRVGMNFARSWELIGDDPVENFIGAPPQQAPLSCANGAFAAPYRTLNNPALFMDPLLSQADHGQVRSLPVPGLVRTGIDNMPWIEPDVVRLCGGSATFPEPGAR